YTDHSDRGYALRMLSRLDGTQRFDRTGQTIGSRTPPISFSYDIAKVLRALLKNGLNLIAAFCPNTSVERPHFPEVKGVILGTRAIPFALFDEMGFVRP